VKVVPSPNHGPRKGGRRPSMVLLHYTGMEDGLSALRRLCDPLAEVSAHYLVWEDGRIFQLVPESARAWHAGSGSWRGDTDVNSASIGIEIVNRGHDWDYPDFPDVQIDAVIALCRDVVARNGIAPREIVAHSDVAPDRKRDPGEKFPWRRLAEAGLGLDVEPAPIEGGRAFSRGDEGQPIRALQAMFGMLGYAMELTGVFDERTEQVVAAFQRRFRPERIDGVADGSTISTLRDAIRARG
jgi:N-acetylmuramoyl-L-alanine amidase